MSLLTAFKYGTNIGSQQTAMLAEMDAGLDGGFMSSLGSAFTKMSPWMAVAGAVQSAIGSYYQVKSQKLQIESQASSLQFQQSLSEINARQAEFQAQNILLAGERQAGQYTMQAGQRMGSTRAALAARGGVLSEGSNLEVMASQELAKEIDTLTINANTVRAAEAARTQRVNYMNQSLMQGVSAANMLASGSSISPFTSAATSLLGSATSIGGQWFRDRRLDAIASRLGLS